MPRSLSIGASPGFEAAVASQGVVEVLFGPRRIHAFDLNVVTIQQLPCWAGCAARGVADLVVEDNGVGVVDEWDVVAQIVTGEILGSDER